MREDDDCIVVAFDGSPNSCNAASWAGSEAARSGVRVELLAVFDWSSEAAQIYGPFVADTYREEALGRLNSDVAREAERLRHAYPVVAVTTSVRTGGPATVLVDRSANRRLDRRGHPGR